MDFILQPDLVVRLSIIFESIYIDAGNRAFGEYDYFRSLHNIIFNQKQTLRMAVSKDPSGICCQHFIRDL